MTGREVCGAMNSSPVEALTLMMQLTGSIAHWLKFLVLLTFSPKMTLWYWKRGFEVWNFLTSSDIKLVRLPCYIDESLMIFCMALHRVIHFQALAANNTITTSFSTTAILVRRGSTVHSLLIAASSSSQLPWGHVPMNDLVKTPDFPPFSRTDRANCSTFLTFAMELLASTLNLNCWVCLCLPWCIVYGQNSKGTSS